MKVKDYFCPEGQPHYERIAELNKQKQNKKEKK